MWVALAFATACSGAAAIDAGGSDAGLDDASLDAGGDLDGGPRDAALADGGAGDSGTDAALPDAGMLDAGPADAGPPPPVRVVALSGHCALRSDGEVRCWGDGTEGELGDGRGVSSETAVRAALPGPATDVSCGPSHCCAIVEGQVWCWGSNNVGQVGRPFSDTGFPYQLLEPVRAVYDGEAVTVAAGSGATCALSVAGEVWCWGRFLTGEEPATQHEPRQWALSGGAPLEVSVGSGAGCVTTLREGRREAWCFTDDAREATFARRCDEVVARSGVAYCALGAELYCWSIDGTSRCWDGLARRVDWPRMEGYSSIVAIREECVVFRGWSEVSCGGSSARQELRPDTFDVGWRGRGRAAVGTTGTTVYQATTDGPVDVLGVID